MFRYRDRDFADKIIEKLRKLNVNVVLMHVCGTHQDTIVRYGLDSLLESCGVDVRQGPGCPICVTTPTEYEEMITLAENGNVVTAFGDAVRAPGYTRSLMDARAQGCDVRIVYSIEDAVKIASRTDKNVVFMAVGFETTAPTTAAVMLQKPPKNFSILCCHRYIPPALHTLLSSGEMRIQGLIEPGHVSVIIGIKPYEEISKRYRIPQVIAGFEPLDMMMAIYMLAKQISTGEAKVQNEYTRTVHYEGNEKALKLLGEVFEPSDIVWRGFPTIPSSAMKLKPEFSTYDARDIYSTALEKVKEHTFEESRQCRCGEILRGLVEPKDCLLFANVCTPQHPIGPCMVSVEGSCNIEYRYRGKHAAREQRDSISY
jgi:hydrogenase expression/formation protein HypD